MTISQAFSNFIRSRALRGLAKKSIECYTNFNEPFIIAVGASTSIFNLTRETIDDYFYTLFEGGNTMATIATYIRHIKIFLRWAESEYHLAINAKTIVLPKTPKKQVRIYNDEEIILIFRTIQAEKPWITSRNRAIVALMLDSGLRQNEVCTLKTSNIQFENKMLKVLGKGAKERMVPIGSITRHYLKEYLASCPYQSENTFVSRRGKKLTCDAVKHLISKVAKQLPFDFSSHKLRHNFATNYCIDQYEKYGRIDIFQLMSIMGHENIATTQKYLHYAMDIIAARADVSHINKLIKEVI